MEYSKQVLICLPRKEAEAIRNFITTSRSTRLARTVILNIAEGMLLDGEVTTVDLNEYVLMNQAELGSPGLKFRLSAKRNPYLCEQYESWDWGTRYENLSALLCKVVAQIEDSDRWKRFVTISAQSKTSSKGSPALPPPVVPDDEKQEPVLDRDDASIGATFGVGHEVVSELDDNVFDELDLGIEGDDLDATASKVFDSTGGFS